jgi:hypothetical protein
VIAKESTAYVAAHPQLKQLLHDFITTVSVQAQESSQRPGTCEWHPLVHEMPQSVSILAGGKLTLVPAGFPVFSSLASKPSNVHLFARDYFSNFLPETTADAELEALADGDEAEEEALMKGDDEQ